VTATRVFRKTVHVGAFFVDRADFSADPVRDGEFRNEALDFVCQRLSIMSAHKSDFTECLDEHFRNPSRPFRGNRVCGKMGREKFRTQKLRIRDQSAMELFARRTVSSTFSAGNFAASARFSIDSRVSAQLMDARLRAAQRESIANDRR
jgi:hypothetical protein